MAIETVLQELTAAVRELTAALKSQPTKVEAPKAEVPKPAATPTVTATATATPQAVSAQAGATAPAAPAPAATEVSYDAVKAAITKLVSIKGNEAAAAVLESFGVKRGPALKPEQYAAVVAACEAA